MKSRRLRKNVTKSLFVLVAALLMSVFLSYPVLADQVGTARATQSATDSIEVYDVVADPATSANVTSDTASNAAGDAAVEASRDTTDVQTPSANDSQPSATDSVPNNTNSANTVSGDAANDSDAASNSDAANDADATDISSVTGDAAEATIVDAAMVDSPDAPDASSSDDPDTPDALGATNGTPTLKYCAHVQNIGWQEWKKDGQTAGTSGKGLRVEALKIEIENAPTGCGIEYSMHVQNIGWKDWVKDGDLGGTSGRGLRVEAMKLRLYGKELTENYDLYYRVHAQNLGWLGWVKNGVAAGTSGLAYRLEAIEIRLVKRGDPAPGDTTPALIYRGHVQNIGWQNWVTPSKTAGTSGKGLRVEALQARIMNADGGIRVMAHVQNIGWQNWTGNGGVAGTSGRALRVEAIRVELTGNIKEEYDIYYRVHAQNLGWLNWAKNGENAGSAGFGYRLEAIQLKLVKRGGAAPKNDGKPYAYLGPVGIEYRTIQKGQNWSGWAKSGATSGTTGKSLPVEGFGVRIPDGATTLQGGVTYRAYTQDSGWGSWASNGADAGLPSGNKRTEAIQIKLTGDIASAYDVYYRVHAQDFGWMGWTKNGGSAGTNGMGLRIEAIQVKLVAKGASAPGSTANAFFNKGVNKTGYQNPAGFYQVSANTVVLTPAAYKTPFCYVTPSRIKVDATRQDCVNAFIQRAREYVGTPYVWDYSRQPGVGVDCIGLVYQCAYATGMDLGGGGPNDRYAFNPYAHWYSGSNGWHSHDANNFWNDGKAKHVSLSDRKPGDVIYWPGHVAIYIGNDQIIEAYSPSTGVRYSSLWSNGTPRGCIRLYQ